MKEYIERAAVKNLLDRYGATDDAMALIDTIPAADVAEVRHGRWINTNKEVEQMCKCSECGYPISYFWSRTPYCPNCGARMDKEDEHEVS
mgnify:CR=1 FL=1|nr:MAG TPA: hypothetical protein [Caudoviricetes sp.]